MKHNLNDSMAARDAFFANICSGKENLFSFEFNGERLFSSQLPVKELASEAGKKAFAWELADAKALLEVHFMTDDELPFLEYECFFSNPEKENSGTITDFHALEFACSLSQYYEKQFCHLTAFHTKMTYYLGSISKSDDFQRREKILTQRLEENHLTLGSSEIGRCSHVHMPFFRADVDEQMGFDFAVGWSGSWKGGACIRENELHVYFGMPKSSFYLKPGEKLRAPGAFIGFRKNYPEEMFINIHRRYMMKHHAPRDSRGNMLLPPVSAVDWGGVKSSDMMILLDHIRDHEIPIETHWIDAGWMGEDAPCPHFFDPAGGNFPSNWPERIGTLRINGYSHPDTLRPVADHAAAAGINTLLWFENERVHVNCGDASLKEHPEWFLSDGVSEKYKLLNLGDDAARQWLTDSVINFMKENHIENYRQDYNINPLPYWLRADEPGRTGVTEMKYINALYRFWGDLRKAFPDMFIDNCASGGRRLDYMLGTHSFPLCQSDYGCHHECSYTAMHLQNFFLNEIYPLHSTLSWMPENDLYAAFSSGCGMGVGTKAWNFPSRYPGADYPFDVYRETLKAILEMRSCMTGNYYALTPHPDERSSFCAMQAFNSEANKGFILVFRHPQTAEQEFFSSLREIDEEALWEFREFSKNQTAVVRGDKFKEFRCEMPAPRSVRLFFYSKK